MAKSSVNHDLLKSIASGAVTHVSQSDGVPLLQHAPALIEVNTADLNEKGEAAVRLTADGHSLVAPIKEPSKYGLITGAVLPPAKKRGNSFGSGAPTKYPFADMEIGAMFFSANSEHAKGDAVKALGSTVSSQNRKYAEEIAGETRTVTRAIRDKKTHKALLDEKGEKQLETVTLPKLKYNRKFTIRPVVGGETYGLWTAPSDGALIARVE